MAIVELLVASDRSPSEIAATLGIESNLMAHHVKVLKAEGLVREVVSSGDRRRRYLQLEGYALALPTERATITAGTVLFVCTQNSARSQLAAAIFAQAAKKPASSAGTHPADRVHPLAVAIAREHGLDLELARPRALADVDVNADLVVTVCDQANEALRGLQAPRLHWSIPDPAVTNTRDAFERAYLSLEHRIGMLAGTRAP